MNLIRTLLLAVVAGLSVLGGTPSTATANSSAAMTKTRYYYVYYRWSAHDSWHYYGAYQSSQYAAYVASYLHYWYGVETFWR